MNHVGGLRNPPVAKGDVLNGIDVGEMRQYIDECKRNPSEAERNPEIVAKWAGGSRAEIAFGDTVVRMGDEYPSARKMLLASLAASDVEVVATPASLLGLELPDLEIEATGHLDIRRLLGLEGPDPGYDRTGDTVRIRAPSATKEQVARLKEVCERASPVGDSLARKVPASLRLEVMPSFRSSGTERSLVRFDARENHGTRSYAACLTAKPPTHHRRVLMWLPRLVAAG